MRKLPFKQSTRVSLGVELELQLIDPHGYGLVPRAKELIREIQQSPYQKFIKPEITQSMIEINSSIHQCPKTLGEELEKLSQRLVEIANSFGMRISGGGIHPFQKWSMQKIFPTLRYKKLARQYRYLSKRSTIFGQHIHIGCSNCEEALYLTHALAPYIPHFIALSASSPFYQGTDTGFQSSRCNVFSPFPLSGVIPYLTTWQAFSDYYYKMKQFKIIESMKDFYWDIRPKPEFGTVELRVCDTPLALKTATMIAAYLQTLALYLIKEQPITISPDLYLVYNYNRFQASRYGFAGVLINPLTAQTTSIKDDILATVKSMEHYANELNTMPYLLSLVQQVSHEQNDAKLLRQWLKQYNSYSKVVEKQCEFWEKTN